MPTEITQKFFYPELSIVQVKPLLDDAIPLLNEIRNHGLNVFLRSQLTAKGDEDLPILLVYLHLLEMLDAFCILIAQVSEVPARLQLRAMFEALLSVEYIAQTDTIHRAHAYLVADIVGRKRFYASFDSSTAEGRRFKEALADDPNCAFMNIRSVPDLAQRIENLDQLLAKPSYREALLEYERESGPKKQPVNWYRLFQGPRNLRQLAIRLRRAGTYEVLYGGWSAVGHGSETVRRQLVESHDGGAAIRGLRNPEMLVTAINMAVSLSVAATRCILGRYHPGELDNAYGRWYRREVKPLWDRVEPRRVSGGRIVNPS